MTTNPPTAGRRRSRWALAATALLAPVALLLLLELVLRLAGVGQETDYFLRIDGRSEYAPNSRFTAPYFGKYLARGVTSAVLTREKPAGTYRIFILGESAARGEPNAAFSFARILEAMLSETYPGTRFEIINTGVTAINSHIVRRIARDCRPFRGDLYIVYTGNNEVIGPYSAVGMKAAAMPPLWRVRASIESQSTRIGQLVARMTGETPTRRSWGGMKMFLDNPITRDDPRLPGVYGYFRENLGAICEEARRAGAPILVCTVLTNLRDCPPFTSARRAGLTEDERDRLDVLARRGAEKMAAGDAAGAQAAYEAAAALDAGHAETQFRLGQALFAGGKPAEARKHFELARDLDTLRFRAGAEINGIIREVAGNREGEGIHLLDAEQAVALPAAARGIPGDETFFEHVHFRYEGNYALAAAVFGRVQGLLPPEIRAAAKGDRPPDIGRCSEWLGFSAFSRCALVHDILKITSQPPFPKEKGRKDAAEMRELERAMTPEILAAAADQCRRQVQARPDDLFLRQHLAGIEALRARFGAAEEQFREVLRRGPDIHVRYWLGRMLVEQGRFEESIPEFRSVLADLPGHTESLAALGAVLHRLGRLDEAVKLYEEVLELKPGDPDVQRALEMARGAR